MQEEGDRPQATASIIQARRQLSDVQDTTGTAPARNQAIQRECQGTEPTSDPQQQQQHRPVHKCEEHKNIIVQ